LTAQRVNNDDAIGHFFKNFVFRLSWRRDRPLSKMSMSAIGDFVFNAVHWHGVLLRTDTMVTGYGPK
jgi:hypothetical protein